MAHEPENDQKMKLELEAIDRTIGVINHGLQFLESQMCNVSQAPPICEFVSYIRDLKSDMKKRAVILKETLRIKKAETEPEHKTTDLQQVPS